MKKPKRGRPLKTSVLVKPSELINGLFRNDVQRQSIFAHECLKLVVQEAQDKIKAISTLCPLLKLRLKFKATFKERTDSNGKKSKEK